MPEPMVCQPAPAPAQLEPTEASRTSCTIPEDFSWTAPFVDMQVRKFFAKHKDEYTRAALAVVNGQMTIEKFGLDLGPKRISDWINNKFAVGEDHPRRCLKQHINPSATYETLVKAFKRNPDEHAVVQRLQHGRSDEAQAILDAFLVNGEWEDSGSGESGA